MPHAFAMPSPLATERPVATTEIATGSLKLAQATQPQAQPAPTPAAPAAPAPAPAADAQPAEEPIGNVATVTGSATVTRNNEATALKVKDDIFLNDVVQTSVNSSLGVTFNDATTFNLKANSQITIDNYVYEDGGKQNAALFAVARGTVAFVAAAVAKTGDMKISTPTATLGIRGTSGLVEVPEGASATSRNNVAIKLYPDPDGKVGRIEVNDRAGARLGFLTQGASGFTIRPGAGGLRFAAVPLTISPQQVLRDQGFVRQVHSTQNLGRRLVTEQRDFRRANPGLVNPNRPNRSGQPGLPRQNGQPGQNNLQNRPGPQQPGPQNRPGQPPQPDQPNRQGLQPPGSRQQPGQPQQPGAPLRPGQPNRQGQQQLLPASPPPGSPPRTGQTQQTGTPGQPGSPLAQPGSPLAQPGSPLAQPGSPVNPALPQQPRLSQPGQPPAAPPSGLRPPGLQQGAPRLQRPGLGGKPALQLLRGTAPRGKPPKEKR
jgi:hypothetical protein